MIDYLSALLGQGGAALPVLERRPRALFEPRQTPSMARPLDADDPGVAWPPATARAPDDRVAKNATEHAAATIPDRSSSQSTTREVARDAQPPATLAAATPSASIPAAPRQAHGSPTGPTTTRPAQRRPSPAGDIDDPSFAPRAMAARPGADALAMAEAPLESPPPTRGQDVDAAEVAPATEPRRSREAAAGTLMYQSRASVAATLAMSVVNERARRAEPAPSTQLAPVQISIGRIEIRATPAVAERTRAAAPAAPRLSLDDYLRARNGGTR